MTTTTTDRVARTTDLVKASQAALAGMDSVTYNDRTYPCAPVEIDWYACRVVMRVYCPVCAETMTVAAAVPSHVTAAAQALTYRCQHA